MLLRTNTQLWTRQSVLPPSVSLGWRVPKEPSVSTSAVSQATAEVESVLPHLQSDLVIQGCILRKGSEGVLRSLPR